MPCILPSKSEDEVGGRYLGLLVWPPCLLSGPHPATSVVIEKNNRMHNTAKSRCYLPALPLLVIEFPIPTKSCSVIAVETQARYRRRFRNVMTHSLRDCVYIDNHDQLNTILFANVNAPGHSDSQDRCYFCALQAFKAYREYAAS